METYFLWAAGIFVGILVAQRTITYLLVQRAVMDSYAREINEILTDDQYKVKGRFD